MIAATQSDTGPHPKLSITGRATDGTIKLRVKVPGLLQRFTLSRGPEERPLQFDGEVLALAEAAASNQGTVFRVAIYRTKGGKYVTEFLRRTHPELPLSVTGHELIEGDPNESCKVDVFDNLDAAINWFRPGRLTV